MFSQYFSADSPIHRMSAVSKLYALTGFILLSFFVRGLPWAAGYFGIAVLALAAARLPLGPTVRRTRHLLTLLIIGFLLNWALTGLAEAAVIFLRLYAVVLAAQILTMTTRTAELIDGLERGFHLSRSTVVTILIAMAFIPILRKAYQEICQAQTARGSDWTSGDLRTRIRRLGPILIPLFRYAFRRAEILGEALTVKNFSAER